MLLQERDAHGKERFRLSIAELPRLKIRRTLDQPQDLIWIAVDDTHRPAHEVAGFRRQHFASNEKPNADDLFNQNDRLPCRERSHLNRAIRIVDDARDAERRPGVLSQEFPLRDELQEDVPRR